MPMYEYVIMKKEYRTVRFDADSIQDGYDMVWDDMSHLIREKAEVEDVEVFFDRVVCDE